MKIVNDCELQLVPFAGQINFPAHSLTVLVKATFDISHKSIAKLADDQLPAAADEYYPDDEEQTGSLYYASDFSFFKPHTDILLTGKCHTPGGKQIAACPVSLQIGQFKKTLNVFGSRHWKNVHISPTTTEPKLFQKMDLRYERSFGGVDFDLNPVGRGAVKTDVSIANNVLPVPNIQDPNDPVTSPFVKTAPAGFGPLHSTWGLRQKKLGTYGKNYLRTRWPWFPEDFDWTHFNAAPPDQQLKGYLKGDEKLVFENLHPKFRLFETQLPGIRARCFSRKQNPQTGKRIFEEIILKLDTLWVDMETEKLVLTWRGWMDIIDEDFDEVKHIFLMQESLYDNPTRIETCYERFKQAEAAEDAEFAAPETPTATETGSKKINPPKIKVAGAAGIESSVADASEKEQTMAEIQVKVDVATKQAGIDITTLPTDVQAEIQKNQDKILANINIKKPTPGDNAEQTGSEQQLKEALSHLEVDVDNLPEMSPSAKQEQIRFLNELGVNGDEIAANTEANKIWTILAAALPKMGIDPENLQPFLEHAEPEFNKIKEQLGIKLDATKETAVAEKSGDDVQSSSIKRQVSTGESFVGQDLSGEDFSGMDLHSCDFSSAILTGANFSQANLVNAIFDYANLSQANFTQANLTDAKLNFVDAKAANFSEANCVNISVNNSVFESIEAESSQWQDICGKDAIFIRAKLNNASFQQAQLPGADFESAELCHSNFSLAKLENATFERVNATESNFFKADISGLRASLSANFSGANFSQASGNSPIFSSSNFQGADLSYADMPGSNFDRANLQTANLSATNLKQARFIKANLTNAKVIKANLMQATVERANLHQADIRGSNCYEVEFLNAVVDGLKTDTANLTATKLES